MHVTLFDRPRLVCDLLCLEGNQTETRRGFDTSDALFVVIEGAARIRTGTQTEELQEMDAVLIPPGVDTTIENTGAGQLVVLVTVTPKPTRAAEMRTPEEQPMRGRRLGDRDMSQEQPRGGDRPPYRRFDDARPRPAFRRDDRGGPGLRFVAKAILVRRSGVTTALIRRDQQVMVKASAEDGPPRGRRPAAVRATRWRSAPVRSARGRPTTICTARWRPAAIRTEGVTGRLTQREAAAMGPVPRFGRDDRGGRPPFRRDDLKGLTRPGRHVTATVDMRTAATARREAATGRPTPREAAVRGRLRLGRAALGRAVRAGTTIRGRCGTRATRRAAAGRSRHGRVVAAHRIDREAGRHSGQDRLGAKVRVANAAAMAEGRALAARPGGAGGRPPARYGAPRRDGDSGGDARPARGPANRGGGSGGPPRGRGGPGGPKSDQARRASRGQGPLSGRRGPGQSGPKTSKPRRSP